MSAGYVSSDPKERRKEIAYSSQVLPKEVASNIQPAGKSSEKIVVEEEEERRLRYKQSNFSNLFGTD